MVSVLESELMPVLAWVLMQALALGLQRVWASASGLVLWLVPG